MHDAGNTSGNASGQAAKGAMWVLFLLILCNICSYSDRVVLNLLIGPIKRTLDVSDTAISLLQGLAFALFYTLAIIPIGRLIDSADRTKVIGIGGLVYGASTFVCGIAQKYWTIFLGRMGVGAGESTLQPAAYALLADLFPRAKLPGAIATFHIGAYLGIGGGYVLGGSVIRIVRDAGTITLPVLGHVEAWQLAFMVAALPALVISTLVLLLLKDPRVRPATAERKPLAPIIPFLKGNSAALVPLLIGCSMSALLATAGLSWTPSLFVRAHHMSEHDVGISIGLIIMVLSSLGVLLAGQAANIVTRLGRVDAPLIVAAAGVGLAGLAGAIMPLMPTRETALGLLGVREMFTVFMFPLAAAAVQIITPAEMRGRMSAIYIFTMSIAGNLVGPTITALMNDYVFTGPDGVRYSLATVYGVGAAIGVVSLLAARRPFVARVAA